MNSEQARYLLASIVESSQDSIVTIDLNRTVTSWNKSAAQLYGYPAEEAIGQPLAMVLLPEDIKDLICKVNDIIHEVTVPVYETVRVLRDGKQADLEILLSPVRSASGEVIGVSTIARDITLRRMQEARKDEFISVASHELKTPITSIKAYTEIILEQFERAGDTSTAAMVRKLDIQVDRLIDLIKTLLDTTKLAKGELLLNCELFDLNTLIQDQIETFSMVSDQHNFVFQDGEISPVSADRKLIGQVLANLISNAAKYSPFGGDIIVSSKETPSGILVSVQDFGIGIPAEVRDKIFDRYFRVSDPVVAAASGIGLGLYITSGIVEQHGGTMSVQSEEGSGSTFFFTLPYEACTDGTANEAGNYSGG